MLGTANSLFGQRLPVVISVYAGGMWNEVLAVGLSYTTWEAEKSDCAIHRFG